MKIEKIMTIENFLKICEYSRPTRDIENRESGRRARGESDSPADKANSKYFSELKNNMSESIRKSHFEPICNPWCFSSFGESYYGHYDLRDQYTDYHEFINSFYMWFYKGYVYAPRELKKGNHKELAETLSKEQLSLLILEHYDNERKYFERLKNMYSLSPDEQEGHKRPSIPEKTRIEVWRRDEGKCVKCCRNEKLEYDHIIPISKGGSNTARNIQLLCENCNRSKGANIA